MGAGNHCVHGKSLIPEVILDWRPFEYFTVAQVVNGMKLTITHQLEPLPSGGTRLHTRIRIKTPLPDLATRLVANALFKTSPVAAWHLNIARMLKEELSDADSVDQ